MKAHVTNGDARNANEKLGIFIFYDEFFAGVAAKRTADWLDEVAGDRCRSETEIWKLDSIPVIGPLMNSVARDAMHADVVIVAVTENLSTSVAVRWMTAMSAASRSGVAPQLLIGLLPATRSTGPSEFAARLSLLADRTGMKWVARQSVPTSTYEFEWLYEHLEWVLATKENLPALTAR